MALLLPLLAMLLQSDSYEPGVPGPAFGAGFVVFWLAFLVLVVGGLWGIFVKAGHPGWMAIIPILNIWILLQVCKRPGWWIILLLIPFVSAIVAIVLAWDLARVFGRGIGTMLGLIFLPFIFYPMLGWGSAQYEG